jgi:uncharacterized Rmd1/YagE family protein
LERCLVEERRAGATSAKLLPSSSWSSRSPGSFEHGRAAAGRHTLLKHVGKALLIQNRVSGRVAVAEKPNVVWDRRDLDRLYARLEDEYELKERAEALARKLAVIAGYQTLH